MKSLLIAGGTGFFGTTFIDAFERGWLARWGIKDLIIASRNATKFSRLRRNQNIVYLDLDLTEICVFPECDYIMHFAGSSDSSAYHKNLRQEVFNLEHSMLSFVKSVEYSKINPTNILFVSSGAVYGPTNRESFSENSQVDGKVQFASIKQQYARAKLNSEKTFFNMRKKGCNLSIARAFSFVGAHLPLNSHFVAGNLIRNILRQEPLNVSACHEVVRSYLHTDDLVVWLMEILFNGSPTGEIFNVGSDDCVEIHELARELAATFSLETDINCVVNNKTDFYVPDVNKARSIGLEVKHSSVGAIFKTIQQHQQKLLRYCV